MILQLNAPIWLETPRGLSLCHFLIDYGIETDVYWGCFDQKTGECFWYENTAIKICWNRSIGRNPSQTPLEQIVGVQPITVRECE